MTNQEIIEGKTTWIDVMRKYRPEITEEEANYVLWNETCYPFSDEVALKQLDKYFNQSNPPSTTNKS